MQSLSVSKHYYHQMFYFSRNGSLHTGCPAGGPTPSDSDRDCDSWRAGDILQPGQDVWRADECYHHHYPLRHLELEDINPAPCQNTWYGEGRLLWLQGTVIIFFLLNIEYYKHKSINL